GRARRYRPGGPGIALVPRCWPRERLCRAPPGRESSRARRRCLRWQGGLARRRRCSRRPQTMTPVLSLLDLAVVGREQTVQEGLAGTVALAQAAERCGYERVWYAEHHNNPSIASSATSVLIAHVAAHTDSIRLGAGVVMLPNHAPLI